MTMIMEFAGGLFSFMALKYEIIVPYLPHEERIPVEDQDWSSSDEFTVDIGHAVMMLSYSYRSAFKKQFYTLSKNNPTLLRKNAKFYPLEFAYVTNSNHSPLKILVICALISEMYLFLLFESGSENIIKDYLEPSVTCFNDIYKAVLSKIDDPILKWKDVKRVASVIASGYDVFQPLMETEHPSESKDFFESVEYLVGRLKPPGEVEGQVEELNEQIGKPQNISAAKQETDEDLYTKLKFQSRRVLSKVAHPVTIPGASSSKTSITQGSGRKKAPTTSKIARSQTKEETSSDLHGAVSQTASNISGLDGKGKAGPSKKTKRKNRDNAKKLAAMKAVEHEAYQLMQTRDEDLRDRLSSR